jgi:DNA excision repair protein ERCC-3
MTAGIIVLPCGAGKTLTGVTAVCTIKKRAIVLCTSNIAVEQWRNEFRRWCDVDPNLIRRFTSEDKELPPENCIICCTCVLACLCHVCYVCHAPYALRVHMPSHCVFYRYSMLAHKGNKSEEAERVINFLKSHEWGMMVLDEVRISHHHLGSTYHPRRLVVYFTSTTCFCLMP